MSTYSEESKKADSFETVQDIEPYQIKVGDRLVLKDKFELLEDEVTSVKFLVFRVASGHPIVVGEVYSDRVKVGDVVGTDIPLITFNKYFNVIPAHYYGLVEEL